jgi:S-methyl-5-thioribose-1-phosphate isomerase
LRHTRPTAQNLFYAVDKVLSAICVAGSPSAARIAARQVAEGMAYENAAAGEAIGRHGAALIHDGMRILTHCNAGWLAFVDWGSALAPIYAAARQGKRLFVFADETRPRCQGAQLTAWELEGEGIPHVIIADNAAGYLMRRGEVDMVIVGTDRIAANGDVANKIGTYEKAVCAAANDIPFYVAAPTSTIDPACPSGDDIPIEERSPDEVLYFSGRNEEGELCRVRLAHKGAQARNPAFDVTPARYVTAIITECGIHSPQDLPHPR